MNYNHLHYFYVVVREGSISAASRFLHVSQPSLSSQIKSFEESLGVSLFERKGNKLELTATGKSVYTNASQMFELSASITDTLKGPTKQAGTKIKLGIADEIERPFTVNLVKYLFKKVQRDNPPSLSFTTGLNDELLSNLRSWAVDAVITNRPSSFEDLEIAGTLTMPICFAVATESARGHRGAVACTAKDVFRLLDTLGKGLAVPVPRLKLREEIDAFISKTRKSYPMAFESDTLATIARAIIDNVGVGFVPLPYVLKEVIKKEVIVFGQKEGLWKHTLFLMIKRGRADAVGVVEISQAFENLKAEVTQGIDEISFSNNLDNYLKQMKEH